MDFIDKILSEMADPSYPPDSPPEELTIHPFPHGMRNPFFHTIHSHQDNTIVYYGYWYLEPGVFPVERIFYDANAQKMLHVEVLERLTLEDDPITGTEEDPTFFPTARIQLKYRVIKEIKTNAEQAAIEEVILQGEEAERARNEPLVRERERREYEEMMMSYNGMSSTQYKEWLKGISDQAAL
jgi:hypothetical protein